MSVSHRCRIAALRLRDGTHKKRASRRILHLGCAALLIVSQCLGANDNPTAASDEDLRALVSKLATDIPRVSEYELGKWLGNHPNPFDDDNPGRREKTRVDYEDKLENLLRNAPPAFRARATVALLKPGADRFTPLELIERVSTSQVPAERLAADDARKVRDAFLAYIDARAENARERRRGPALYHHLREATEILSKFAEIYADGMQELPAAALEEGTVTMRGPWIPPETRDEPIPYLCLPYGWTLHGDSLVAAGKKDVAVRVSLHELHGDSIALPKKWWWSQRSLGFRTFCLERGKRCLDQECRGRRVAAIRNEDLVWGRSGWQARVRWMERPTPLLRGAGAVSGTREEPGIRRKSEHIPVCVGCGKWELPKDQTRQGNPFPQR